MKKYNNKGESTILRKNPKTKWNWVPNTFLIQKTKYNPKNQHKKLQRPINILIFFIIQTTNTTRKTNIKNYKDPNVEKNEAE